MIVPEKGMTATASRTPFVFVLSDGPSLPQDGGTRAKIRRQAMSRVRISRQQRVEGQTRKPGDKHITLAARQAHSDGTGSRKSENDVADENNDSRVVRSSKLHRGDRRKSFSITIPPKPLSTGYEAVRIKYQFDVLDLSGFTTFYISLAESRPLLGHPSQVLSRFLNRQWSFFSYLPARFGYNQSCDDAMRCLAAACHHINVYNDPRSPEVFTLYTRALQSLQSALYNPDERFKPEILCAVAILALYELLNMMEEEDLRWREHVRGATHLIEARGPEFYQTDFEKSLLLALAGPIFTEATVDGRYRIVDGYEWQSALKSLIRTNVSPFLDHGKIIHCLWMCANRLPNLFKDVQQVICNSWEPEPETSTTSLFFRAQSLRRHMGSRFDEYGIILPLHSSKDLDQMNDIELNGRLEAVTICLAGTIILNRLIVALQPEAADANSVEDETQRIAQQLLHLGDHFEPVSPRPNLNLNTKVDTAKSAVISETSWRHSIIIASSGGQVGPVLKEAFERWCFYKDCNLKKIAITICDNDQI